MDSKARYRARNREKLRLKGAIYRAANREALRLSSRSYQDRNRINYIYYGMIARCSNPEHHLYRLYGARGIRVCQEWRESLDTFKAWAFDHGWKRGLQIDRFDNDGNYEPSNCWFVTNQINSQKRRTNKLTLADAVEIKRLLDDGISGRAIADEYCVSQMAVSDIKRGATWRNA